MKNGREAFQDESSPVLTKLGLKEFCQSDLYR